MNRSTLVFLIILDIFVMALAAGLFMMRFRSLKSGTGTAALTLPVQTQPQVQEPAPSPVKETKKKDKRNIGFTFRHSKAATVEIIGDFNGWIPEPMNKGQDNRWSAILALPPGEYAYNFVIDGKPIRDPNNPKICNIGRGFPNSYLKVKSFAEERKNGE